MAADKKPRTAADKAPPKQRRRREERAEAFRLLVENVQDYAIFRLSADGNVETWNAGAQRIKGWEAGEIIGQHFSKFYPAEDLAWGKPAWELDEARAKGRLEDEGWRVRKDGSTFWANVVITALYDEDGTVRGFAKVTRDLTERRNAEEARTRFIANAAHELRTPVAVLVGLISYLDQAQQLSPEELAEHVGVLTRQAGRLQGLVENLLDLAQLEEVGQHLTGAPVRVADVVARVLADLPAPAGKRISTALRDEVVLADERRLEQIVTNLLSNAYKHGGDEVVVAAKEDGDFVEIEVADNGPGIDPDLETHLFDPFKRGTDTGTTQGSGLGLAIVKGLVEAYDGKISHDPEASGARFIVRLKKA